MKIAITHHTNFDRVRRGTERFMYGLAHFLADQGHEVQTISCKPGPREIINTDGYVRNAHRRWWIPAMARVGVLESHTFLVTVFLELLNERYDIVHIIGPIWPKWIFNTRPKDTVLHGKIRPICNMMRRKGRFIRVTINGFSAWIVIFE